MTAVSLSLLAETGRDWMDWTVLVAGVVAASASVYLVYALRRTHTRCKFGRAFIRVSDSGRRMMVILHVHIAPGAPSWELKRYSVTIEHNGKELDVVTRLGIPEMSDREFKDDLQYEVDNVRGPVSVEVKVAFRHGGKASYKDTVPFPSP